MIVQRQKAPGIGDKHYFDRSLWVRILVLTFLLMSSMVFPQNEKLSLLDAVRITLDKNPNIRLQEQQVVSERGTLLRVSSLFDPQLSLSLQRKREYSPQFSVPSFFQTGLLYNQIQTTAYSADIYKQFAWGVTFQPAVYFSRIDDEAYYPYLLQPANSATVNFTVTIPLLRGRFGKDVRATQKGAESSYAASLMNLKYTISEEVYNTIQAYWNYVAALKLVDKAQESYDRIRFVLNEISSLVEADELPAAELKQLYADDMNRGISMSNANLKLYDARQTLGRAMGIANDQAAKIQLPADDFPARITVADSSLQVDSFFEIAKANRSDYKALQNKRLAAYQYASAQKNNMLSQLDLSVNVGYSGFELGDKSRQYYTTFNKNKSDRNIAASLSYQLPIRNRLATGYYLQQQSILQQLEIQIQEWERSTRYDLNITVAALQAVLKQLEMSLEAENLYKISQENEMEKIKLGESTVINLGSVEDKLTQAANNYVNTQYQYANIILKLRFLTGTLIDHRRESNEINLQQLTTLPISTH